MPVDNLLMLQFSSRIVSHLTVHITSDLM